MNSTRGKQNLISLQQIRNIIEKTYLEKEPWKDGVHTVLPADTAASAVLVAYEVPVPDHESAVRLILSGTEN